MRRPRRAGPCRCRADPCGSEGDADADAGGDGMVVGEVRAGRVAGLRIGVAEPQVAHRTGDLDVLAGIDRGKADALVTARRRERRDELVVAATALVHQEGRARPGVGELVPNAERVAGRVVQVDEAAAGGCGEPRRIDLELAPMHPADRAEDQPVGGDAGLEVERHRLGRVDFGRAGGDGGGAHLLGGVELVGHLRLVGQGDAQRDFRLLIGGAERIARGPVVREFGAVARDRAIGAIGGDPIQPDHGRSVGKAHAAMHRPVVVELVAHQGSIALGLHVHVGTGELGGAAERVFDVRTIEMVVHQRHRQLVVELVLVGETGQVVVARHTAGVASAVDAHAIHRRTDPAIGQFDVILAFLEQHADRLRGPFDPAGGHRSRAEGEQACPHKNVFHLNLFPRV
ncbi:hypothetical protein SDC9_36584 [bioreactor metagenome]|uniref:Uncharacterized protein n=1 Tax=bioreactor metagenome TaxID=1076179 RepID=A0A644VIP2_9ZZZZ